MSALFHVITRTNVVVTFWLTLLATQSRGSTNIDDVLVTPSWLHERLQRGTPDKPEVLVIEASSTITEHQSDIEHIPGASLLYLRHCSTSTPTRPLNNPDPQCFQSYLRCLGVDDTTPVIVYDRTDFLKESARTWWTISKLYGRPSVAVLNGGLVRWKQQGFPTDVDNWRRHVECDSPDGTWTAKYSGQYFRNITQMIDDVLYGSRQIIDTRLSQNFRGDEVEPSAIIIGALVASNQSLWQRMRRGHMPSSHNIPFLTIIDPSTAQILDRTHLQRVFQTAGVDVRRPLTTTCYIGSTACLVLLAAVHCGAEDVAVYSGSWTEWSQLVGSDLVERDDPETAFQSCMRDRTTAAAVFREAVKLNAEMCKQ